MDFKALFEKNWFGNHFPSRKEKILVAVSGGKDSMCLANLLHELGFEIAIAHCNFQLRSDDADLDQNLVENWGKENNTLVHTIRFDTEAAMQKYKTGIQETARKLRYDWFQELCGKHEYKAICTAHHAHDNAETVLINFFKGTGIAGLHGIPLKNNNILRPLLFASRQEIDAYVLEHKIEFREDVSNASLKYLRNAVRNKILPQIGEYFSDAISKINENSQRISEAEILYRQAIELHKKNLLEKRGEDIYIPILKLQKLPAYKTICFEIFSEYGYKPTQNNEILKLIESESGHYVASQTHKVIRDRMFLIITEINSIDTDLFLVNELPETIETKEAIIKFKSLEMPATIIASANVAQIDMAMLSFPLILRRWRTGDYFYPLGMGMKKKKLSRFLIDLKTPIHEKEKIWVLECNKKIVWIVGLRMDERFKILERTKNVLHIDFMKK